MNWPIWLSFLIGLIIGTYLLGDDGKYEGITAQDWAGDYYALAGCVEDGLSYAETLKEAEEINDCL